MRRVMMRLSVALRFTGVEFSMTRSWLYRNVSLGFSPPKFASERLLSVMDCHSERGDDDHFVGAVREGEGKIAERSSA